MIAVLPHRAGMTQPIALTAASALGGRGVSHLRGSRASKVRHPCLDMPFMGISPDLPAALPRAAGPLRISFSRDRHVLGGRSDRACSASPIHQTGPR